MNVDKSEGKLEPTRTNRNLPLCATHGSLVPGLPIGEDGAFCCGTMLAHGPGLGEDEEELEDLWV